MENYFSILEVFHRDGYRKIDQLQDVMGDAKLYTTHIHAMKSACANIGAVMLAEEAKDLEAAGTRGDYNYIATRNNHFIRSLQRTLVSIGKAIKAKEVQDGDDKKHLGTDLLNEELEILLHALDEYDSVGISKSSYALRAYTQLEGVGPMLSSILESTLIGEYEKAAEDIRQLIKVLG